jgi:hypothetical protein
MRVSRLMCFVGEHHWETVTDAGGALTTCNRCGTIRHVFAASSPHTTEEVAAEIRKDVEADASRPSTGGPGV